MSQTTIQKSNAIRTGSAKVEISANGTTFTDIGALRKISLESLAKVDVIKFDNVDELKKFSDGKKVKFKAELAEINWENIEMFRDGHVSAVVTAGVDTKVNFSASGKLIGKFLRITNRDGNGNDMTINLRDVTMTNALNLPFIADDEADVMTMPIELEGYFVDTDAIVDEQVS